MVVKVDDTVLAYHGVMIYDAKVLKIDHGTGVQESNSGAESGKVNPNTQYYVHYQGWHKKWDEWVRHDRVLEDTPANRHLQQKAKADFAAMKKEKSALGKKKKISTNGIATATSKKSPFKKMKSNVDNDTEDLLMGTDSEGPHGIKGNGNSGSTKPISLQMPFSLKKQLVEDWKQITHEPYKLVPLPRKPNVAQIIANYLEFKKSKVQEGNLVEEKELKNVEGIMEGIQSYFDRALGSILLYRMERQQYQAIKQKHVDVPLSQIYGGEHLIRLFVRLPILLGSTNMSGRELQQIQTRLNDFLKYLQKNSASWFLPEYEAATQKYIDRAIASS